MLKKFFSSPSSTIFFALYLFLTLVIFAFSLRNGTESSNDSSFVWAVLSSVFNVEGNYEFLIRKLIGHFLMFLLLAILGSIVYYRIVIISPFKRKRLFFALLTLTAGLLTAIISELLQLNFFTIGRNASITDVLIDFSGFLLGFLLFLFFKPFFTKTKLPVV
ncbi:MAG: VanZ family protein [Clostridia bacterium]|nr:VanZ family protein [Clostridia bacterium]